MELVISHLPGAFLRRGIYPEPEGSALPLRACKMHPPAAQALVALDLGTSGLLRFSDIFRGAMASLEAIRIKRGVQQPAYSHHNYGGAFDLDVERSLKATGMTYDKLLGKCASFGWFCHRRDRERGREDWHFNFLGPNPAKHLDLTSSSWLRKSSWAAPAESRIMELYAPEFVLSPKDIQQALYEVRLYCGETDGNIGPLTTQAILAFQRTWSLQDDGVAGPRTQRVLAYVTAREVTVALPGMGVG